MRLFNPIINVFRKMNDGQKFSFIGTILGIPIIVLTIIVLSSLTDEMNSMKVRLHGVYYETLFKDLLRDVQQYRLYTYMEVTHGEKISETKEKRTQINETLEQIKRYSMETKHEILTEEHIEELLQQWEQTENIVPAYAKPKHDAFIISIIDLMEMVAGKSKLILATDEFTYYLIYDVTKTLPKLIEHMGQIRITGVNEQNRLTELERRQIIYHLSGIESYANDLTYSHKMKLEEKHPQATNDSLDIKNIIDVISNFTTYVENDFLDETNDGEQLILEATKTIDVTFHYYHAQTEELENIIQRQLAKKKQLTICVITLQFIAFLLTLYSTFGFYFSIRNSIKEMRLERKNVREKYVQTQEMLKQMTKTMAQKVMQAHEEERKNIVRDLHDSIGQSLYSMIVKLKIAEQQKGETLQRNLESIAKIAEYSLEEMKRISHTIRPEILDDLGFIPALKSYMEDYKKTYEIDVHFEFTGSKVRLDQEIETQLFRICQEALTNVAKHAEATCVHIAINVDEKDVSLMIKDDGKGLHLDACAASDEKDGIGLFSMKERAESLQGTFHIHSNINIGTTIEVTVPRK